MSPKAQLVTQEDIDAFVLLLRPRLGNFVTNIAAAKREIAELESQPPGLESQALLTATYRRLNLQQSMELEIVGAIRVAWDRVRVRAGKAAHREQFDAEMMAAPAVQEMLQALAG